MAFYRICPDCGAYLDPGEQCSCHEECLIEMERKEKAKARDDIRGLPITIIFGYVQEEEDLSSGRPGDGG